MTFFGEYQNSLLFRCEATVNGSVQLVDLEILKPIFNKYISVGMSEATIEKVKQDIVEFVLKNIENCTSADVTVSRPVVGSCPECKFYPIFSAKQKRGNILYCIQCPWSK